MIPLNSPYGNVLKYAMPSWSFWPEAFCGAHHDDVMLSDGHILMAIARRPRHIVHKHINISRCVQSCLPVLLKHKKRIYIFIIIIVIIVRSHLAQVSILDRM